MIGKQTRQVFFSIRPGVILHNYIVLLVVSEHRSAINRKVPGYLDDHFTKGHGKTPATHLTVVGIERVLPLGDEDLLNTRESLWINAYDSIQFGANTRR